MTDREKLLNILNTPRIDSISSILDAFLFLYEDDISVREIYNSIKSLNRSLENKIQKLDEARFTASERATYIKKYLEGKMWQDEETAKFYLQPQIDNAQDIIDACKFK